MRSFVFLLAPFPAQGLRWPAIIPKKKEKGQENQGRLRLELAKLVTWAQQKASKLPDWRAYVQAQLAAAPEDGKVAWLACKAYLDSVERLDPGSQQHQRVVGLLRAKEAATTEQEQCLVLGERLSCLRDAEAYPQAVALIRETAASIRGDQRAKLDEEAARLEQEAAEHELSMARQAARSERDRRGSRLEYYQSCAERAVQAGNVEEARRLEALIAELQREAARP